MGMTVPYSPTDITQLPFSITYFKIIYRGVSGILIRLDIRSITGKKTWFCFAEARMKYDLKRKFFDILYSK